MNPEGTEASFLGSTFQRFKEVSRTFKGLHTERSVSVFIRDVPIGTNCARFAMRLRKGQRPGIVLGEEAARIIHFQRIHILNDLEQFWFFPGPFAPSIETLGHADHGTLIA